MLGKGLFRNTAKKRWKGKDVVEVVVASNGMAVTNRQLNYSDLLAAVLAKNATGRRGRVNCKFRAMAFFSTPASTQ